MSYATNIEKKKAEMLGYTVMENQRNGTRFTNGTRRVWAIRLSSQSEYLRIGWQTADLIDGSFTNHKKFLDLNEALEREVK